MASFSSFISNAHPAYIESTYKEFKKNPASIDPEWKKFFEGFDFAVSTLSENGNEQISPLEFNVLNLIHAYRAKGHLEAITNPIRPRKNRKANLDLQTFGLNDSHLEQEFFAGHEIGLGKTKLKVIIAKLRKLYCHHIGIEYTYITDSEVHYWVRDKFEKEALEIQLPAEKKKRILYKLNQTAVFEKFLHTKYIGQKRFSLEGGDTTIPALDAIINKIADLGAEEIVIGMAHRGRLNVLVNILGKTYDQVFSEFEGIMPEDKTMGDGDVKYHLGFSSQVQTLSGKTIYLKLTPNPSHLEAVNPVVEGFVRAKADVMYAEDFDKILPVIIHGDAALPGQGVVYEVAQMSKLDGYNTGGTIHFVINNQIGFTTDFEDARSSHYSTNVASVIESPVFHVNGDDPEAVIFVSEFAAEFRQKFNRDVFIDMVCYRKHGHNEGDDPKYTQPHLYNLIEKHQSTREIYTEQLIKHGSVDANIAKEMEQDFWKMLQDRLDMVKENPLPYKYQEPELAWKTLRKATTADFDFSPDTSIEKNNLDRIIIGMLMVPEKFKPLKKVEKLLADTREMFQHGKINWAMSELIAYGSLLLEGFDVRMSGQDVKRGTFSHRHATIYDKDSNREHHRLNNLAEKQGRFRIYNSLLSEFGVLGFEYGYSLANPMTLTIWEAQFGDFINGAQTIIDEFITSSETKWLRMSGLVMLLPHGYEGQGPDHSSARLERFLQSCAENNIIVANITTPANFFHILRRQLKFPFRKPLIVMSPKSLLRHPECISDVIELTDEKFKEVIDDKFDLMNAAKVKKLILCSGKIYYELNDQRNKSGYSDAAIVRVEQLYPFPLKQLETIIAKYSKAKIYWVQEESFNMGAATFVYMQMKGQNIEIISRDESASPATGFAKLHANEQNEILDKALSLTSTPLQ